MKSKTLALFAAMLITGAAAPSLSHAQQAAPAQNAPETPEPARGQHMLDLYAQRLNLTEDQKQQIKPILEDRQRSLRELRSDTSSRPMKKHREMKSIMHDSDAKIKAVLSADQQKQYDDLQKELREKMRERKKNRGQNA